MNTQTLPPIRRRIGLVGCVKEKAGWAMPAQDLYTSSLFAGRRRYVEASSTNGGFFRQNMGSFTLPPNLPLTM